MREFGLSTMIRSTPERIWKVLTDLSDYSSWNTLIPAAAGSIVAGSQLDLRIAESRGTGIFQPYVLEVEPNRQLLLAASIGHASLLSMRHLFILESRSELETVLHQRWVVTGVLTTLLWPVLIRRMARFSRFGQDLKTAVESQS